MIPRRVIYWLTAGAVALPIAAGVPVIWHHGGFLPAHVKHLGKITEPEIRECSGVVASHRYPGVFWTHNDSGNREVLYAIRRNGTLIGTWPITDAHFVDWEEITFDTEGNLLLADTGDNHCWRRHGYIHRVKEPDPTKPSGPITIEHSWILTYPNGPRDVEAIFVLGDFCHLITKSTSGPAEIYRFALSVGTNPIDLEPIGKLNVGSRVSGAALSPDAAVLALVSSAGAFAYRMDGNVASLPSLVPHFSRLKNRKVEGCTFVPEGLLATSEARHIYLFTDEAFRPVPAIPARNSRSSSSHPPR